MASGELESFLRVGAQDLFSTVGEPAVLVLCLTGKRIELTAVLSPAEVVFELASKFGGSVLCDRTALVPCSECRVRPAAGDVLEIAGDSFEIGTVTGSAYEPTWKLAVGLRS